MTLTTSTDDADHVQGGPGRRTRVLWTALVVVLLGSFAVLGRMGFSINANKPPIP
jgi:hypothetical protein